jgi:thioredoxin reductase (NADPH)
MSVRDLIIVGAGPSGLSAAIAARQRGIDYQVLEQGVLVNSIFRFPPQMVFFTTPELLEIGGLPFVSPYDKPTRAEALIYYRKVVDKYDLQISLDETVLSVSPEVEADVQPPNTLSTPSPLRSIEEEDSALSASSAANLPKRFALETRTSRGVRRVRHARHVLFAIGYYDHPVRLGVPGEDLPHVRHYYGEPHPYYRQRVVIVGGGNSAAEAALEMYRAGAHVTLVHRASELKSTIKYWVRPDIENRIKEGSVAARFNTCVAEIRPTSVVVRTGEAGRAGGAGEAGRAGGDEEIAADAVFLLTGYRADADLLRRAGVELNERDAPVYNPETFETNVPGLFIAGGAIAGVDTGTIFIENGRFHGERIVETIAGRTED